MIIPVFECSSQNPDTNPTQNLGQKLEDAVSTTSDKAVAPSKGKAINNGQKFQTLDPDSQL